MAFYLWMLLYLGAAAFSAGVGIHFLRSERKTVSKLCLAYLLFLIATWAFFDFISSIVDSTEVSTLILRAQFTVLSFVPVLFILIPHCMRNELNKKIIFLFIIPVVLAGIVLFTGDFAETEYLANGYGYHINYNIPAVLVWSAIYIASIAAGFYLFYKIHCGCASNQLKKKINFFCTGCMVALLAAFCLNIFSMMFYEIPPIGSIIASVGVGIVALCFKL